MGTEADLEHAFSQQSTTEGPSVPVPSLFRKNLLEFPSVGAHCTPERLQWKR